MTDTVCTAHWRGLAADEWEAYAVDGARPRFLAQPATLVEVAETLKEAADQRLAVVPRGGGTKMGLGGPPRAADLILSTQRLNRIMDYTPADLTVTVEAGMRLADLQETLRRERQFLALDPPGGPQATVGGVIAANASGPRRLRYGSARDVVIGVRVAQTNGTVTKAGAKVVKNVAGYDLNKLYVGSLGTLVVLGEVSFKLSPLPELYRSLAVTMPSVEAAMTVVRRVLRSPLSPTALEIANQAAVTSLPRLQPYRGSSVLLLAEVDGFGQAVERSLRDLEGYCREAGAGQVTRLDDEPAQEAWADLREAASRLQAALTLKIAVPVTAVAALIAAVEAPHSGLTGPAVVSHAGSGIIYVYAQAPQDGPTLAGTVADLRARAVHAGGSLVVERCPAELKAAVDVWGDVGPALRVMRTLKETFDPSGVLNPGRFVGGI